jgi:hypothetical protein
LSQQVSAQLEEHFKEKVFKSIIPRNIRLAEAPSHGLPGVIFDPSSRGALGYVDFAAELVERMPQSRTPAGAAGPAGETGGREAARPAAPRETPAGAAVEATARAAQSTPTKPEDPTTMQAPTYATSRMGAGRSGSGPRSQDGSGQPLPMHRAPAEGEPAIGQAAALPNASHGEPLR